MVTPASAMDAAAALRKRRRESLASSSRSASFNSLSAVANASAKSAVPLNSPSVRQYV